MMKELEDRIRMDGQVLPGNILKVGSFLNQKIDYRLLADMGAEAARLFGGCGITKVVTVETSGIAIACAAGMALGADIVFAKKHQTGNVSGELYSATAHSYTHNNDYRMIVPTAYLGPDDTVLLTDDFLATGAAFFALLDIVKQSGAKLAGILAQVEKGFQDGGKKLRDMGIRVESLAIVDSMENGLVFRS